MSHLVIAVRDANARPRSQQLFSSADEGEPSRRVPDRAGTLGCLVFQTRISFALSSVRVCWQTICLSLGKAAPSTPKGLRLFIICINIHSAAARRATSLCIAPNHASERFNYLSVCALESVFRLYHPENGMSITKGAVA